MAQDPRVMLERFAIFTIHGERCYICVEPVSFLGMEVDHIIPQSLLKDLPRLAEVKDLLGRPPLFDVNGYENRLPTCRRCNGAKRERAWDPSLLVQLCLQIAADKAPDVEAMVKRQESDRAIVSALFVLGNAAENGGLPAAVLHSFGDLLTFQRDFREVRLRDEPVVVTHEFGLEVKTHTVTRVRTSIAVLRRKALISYGYTCAVTGPGLPTLLEIAFIVALGHRTNVADSVQSVLVLRPDIHRLFDRGLIAIHPDSMTILVAEELRHTDYAKYHGQPACFPFEGQTHPDPQLLKQHLNEFANQQWMT